MKVFMLALAGAFVAASFAAADDSTMSSAPAMQGPSMSAPAPSMQGTGPAMSGSTTQEPAMQGAAPAMTGSAADAGNMTAPNTMAGSGDLAAPDTMALQNAMMADPKVGNELRFAPSAAHKVIYTNLEAAEMFAEHGPAVLFFAADWCPYCQADLRDINTNGAQLSKDITVIVVNYDKSAMLKAKYGVTVQDTFVQIDSKGDKLTAWNGGGVAALNKNVMRG
jgi:thiol-disulfide isomerase/thioredoxin